MEISEHARKSIESIILRFLNPKDPDEVYTDDLIADITEAFEWDRPVNEIIIKVDNIQALSELKEILEAFKQKYPLTEILWKTFTETLLR